MARAWGTTPDQLRTVSGAEWWAMAYVDHRIAEARAKRR